MIPQKCASTASASIQPIKDNIIIECEEKVITYQANEVGLHSTEDVLREHLCAKLKEVSPDTDATNVSTLLLLSHTHAEIFNLLQDPVLLIAKVQTVGSQTSVASHVADTIRKSHTHSADRDDRDKCTPTKQQMEPVPEDKLQIGEDLFHKVAEIETELCAQITGMLLEMDSDSLKRLLVDDEALETASSKAKTRYLAKHHPGVLPGREDMGEEIYEAVHSIYPEYAAKITGMILELDATTLQQLLDSPMMLEDRAKIAFETVSKCSS